MKLFVSLCPALFPGIRIGCLVAPGALAQTFGQAKCWRVRLRRSRIASEAGISMVKTGASLRPDSRASANAPPADGIRRLADALA